jgi:uncharacterized protein (TIGR02145 family)
MRKIGFVVTNIVVVIAALFLCVGCNDGGVESGGGDAVAYLERFYGYETVTIGNQSWTKKNLNIETEDSRCYKDHPDSCEKYGRLYTWEAAKSVCQSIGMKLPTKQDWSILVAAVGGKATAGKKLKAKNGWTWGGGNGTDDYGFSALPGGLWNGDEYNSSGYSGLWWAATEDDGTVGHAHCIILEDDRTGANESSTSKDCGLSVRCVKN